LKTSVGQFLEWHYNDWKSSNQNIEDTEDFSRMLYSRIYSHQHMIDQRNLMLKAWNASRRVHQ